MTKTKTWVGRATALTALTASATLAIAGLAVADNINDTIEDGGVGLTMEASSTASAVGKIKLVSVPNDGDSGCNVDAGENPLKLQLNTPDGVTAVPNPLSITQCDVFYNVTFTASSTAKSGTVTATILSPLPAGGGTYNNNVNIPITITQPVPTNTAPSVSVSGVANGAEYVTGSVPNPACDVSDAEDTDESATPQVSGGAYDALGSHTVTCSYTDAGGLSDTKSVTYTVVAPPNTAPSVSVTGVASGDYEIGHVPAVGCDVTDAEDSNPSTTPVTTGTLVHGLGSQTVTCSYTDAGGLSDSDSVTYTIVDTGNPTIGHSLSPSTGPNANDWYKTNVAVTFNCADIGGSGIDTCTGDTTLGEGANQSVTGTATDWAGNTASDTVSGINIDTTKPTVGFNGGPGGDYVFGSDPAAPTCDGADALSGLASCVISGGGTTVGLHSYTATATDKAGNVNTATLSYKVLPWTTKGYYAPVDMNNVWNTVKGGSTVPLKYEAFAGNTELTSTSAVKSFVAKAVACPGASAPVDEIETVLTGGTTIRYDSTGGQFIQNWQTPKKPGTCYQAITTLQDGSTISANFMLK